MRTNSAGVELIKRWESLRTSAYLCPAGIPTIGYGHTRDVHLGQTITAHQAEVILESDLGEYEAGVERLCPGCNENEFSALVSFAYNLGVKALEASGLRRKLLAGDRTGAADEFRHWTKARVNGALVDLPGLVARREAERALFLAPVST